MRSLSVGTQSANERIGVISDNNDYNEIEGPGRESGGACELEFERDFFLPPPPHPVFCQGCHEYPRDRIDAWPARHLSAQHQVCTSIDVDNQALALFAFVAGALGEARGVDFERRAACRADPQSAGRHRPGAAPAPSIGRFPKSVLAIVQRGVFGLMALDPSYWHLPTSTSLPLPFPLMGMMTFHFPSGGL